jgi:uncharacterized membrane protein
MDTIHLLDISLSSFNLFSFMAGMFCSSLLGWRSAWRSLIFVVIYVACLALYYALMYNLHLTK